MSKKQRSKPLTMLKEEVLLRRLRPDHPKLREINSNYNKRYAGYQGEVNIDYHLKFLPSSGNYHIIRNLRLINNAEAFEIDTLVLTSFMFVIIESKNFSGTLRIEPQSNQFIRRINQKDEVYPNPITQVRRQALNLERWMAARKIKSVPIHSLVAISDSSTFIEFDSSSKDIYQTLLHAEHIPEKIMEFEKSYANSSANSSLKITHKQLTEVSKIFLQAHSPLNIDVFNQYAIQPAEIFKGVQCPSCSHISMVRVYSSWNCPSCQNKSKSAHHQTVYDYLYLYGTINNKQCRDFLMISSSHLSGRLLRKLYLPFQGSTSHRVYHL